VDNVPRVLSRRSTVRDVDLQLTVRNAASRAQADVVVTADDRGSAGPLLDALRAAVGAPDDVHLTVAGRSLTDDGDVADCALADGAVVDAGKRTDRPESPVLDIVLSCGPDAGRRFALPPGRYVAGRDPTCDVHINDPAISGRHLSVNVTPAAVRIVDLGASNASTLDGAAVPAEPMRLDTLPATLRVGDSAVRIAPHRALDIDAVGNAPSGTGPRVAPPAEPIVVTMPSAPTAATPPGVAVLPAAIPLVAGVALTLVLHQWEFIAFTAMSPLMIIGQAVTDRRSVRRQNRAAQRAHAAALDHARRALATGLAEESVRRHQAAPDLGELCSPTGFLSCRTPDAAGFLELRLGVADQPSDIEVPGGSAVIATAVPLVASLPAIGTLGILGPPAACRGLARSLALQAAALHEPASLRIVVLASGQAASWGWVRWLPHVAPDDPTCVATVGFDADQVAARLAELGTPAPARRSTLVIVDGADPGAAAALSHATAVIWCASDARSLPSSCGAIATISAAERPRLDYASRTTTISGAAPDLVAIDVAAAAARRIASVSGCQPRTAAIPREVRWGDLGEPAPASRWDAASTGVTLGVGAAGRVRVDLVHDGPHVLIAGTTGAGKSELLLTIIAELASRNRPDELSLLLVDHKGGATFGICSRLPHTTGVVTDLDATRAAEHRCRAAAA
jgi:S-DNA-T family DNA segregation ATPase FtsK/SpoIIIE